MVYFGTLIFPFSTKSILLLQGFLLTPQWKNSLLSIFHFYYWPKPLKKEVLKRNPQIILGFFDPDPVLLGKEGGGAKD